MDDVLRRALTALFGQSRYTATKDSIYEDHKPGIIGTIKDTLGGYKAPKGGKINVQPTPSPQPTPVAEKYAQPSPQDIEQRIRDVYIDYGGENLPGLEYIPYFLRAMEMYPMFQYNPYLLPQIAILESSAGQNITRSNNPLNWAARIQAQGGFNPQSAEEAILKAVTGIGERFGQYEPFRQARPLTDEEIMAFANIYEPANPTYGQNLIEGLAKFRDY